MPSFLPTILLLEPSILLLRFYLIYAFFLVIIFIDLLIDINVILQLSLSVILAKKLKAFAIFLPIQPACFLIFLQAKSSWLQFF